MKFISRKEKKMFMKQRPRIAEAFNSLQAIHTLPRSIYHDVETAIAIARKFNKQVLEPIYLSEERKCMQDHNYLAWDFVKKAGEWRFYSLFVPKLFGGQGLNFFALYPFMEEIASVCPGLGHIIFVHYLGIATLFPSFNIRIINKVLRDVAKSEKERNPRLLDLTITEPEAGTDVQEPIIYGKGKITGTATRVEGGFIINARKIFISNGHLSYWHIVNVWEDKKNQRETALQCVIPNGTKGFSFGRCEKKMGNLASTASELIFEDCFVPNEWVTMRAQDPVIKNSKKGPFWYTHTLVDYVTSSSRAGVGAIATGIARSSYERTKQYASKKIVNGEKLINHQWAQILLTEMYRNVNIARLTYMESVYTDMLQGLFKLLNAPFLYLPLTYAPKVFFSLLSPLLNLQIVTWFLRKYYYDWYTDNERNNSTGWASVAKITCSEIGFINTNIALDLTGDDGLCHELGIEKTFRDIKLLEIYESTNQINAMNICHSMVTNDCNDIKYYA